MKVAICIAVILASMLGKVKAEKDYCLLQETDRLSDDAVVEYKCSEVRDMIEERAGFYEIEIINQAQETIHVYLEEDTHNDSFQEFWIQPDSEHFKIFPYHVKYYKFDVGVDCSGASGCAKETSFDGTNLVDGGTYKLTVQSNEACLDGPEYDNVCENLE